MLGIIVYNTKGKREIHPNPKRPRYYNFGRVNGTVLLIRLYSHGLYRERLATLLGSRDGQVKREGLKCNKKTEVHFGLFMRFYTGSVSFGSASDHAMLKVLLGIIAGLRPQPHVGVRDTQGSPHVGVRAGITTISSVDAIQFIGGCSNSKEGVPDCGRSLLEPPRKRPSLGGSGGMPPPPPPECFCKNI